MARPITIVISTTRTDATRIQYEVFAFDEDFTWMGFTPFQG